MLELPNLDFMRTVAVLLVALSHLLLYTHHVDVAGFSGITGVCIFFVHTSLVLMGSLERDPNIGRFYLRRIFRIYPLWLVVLGLVLVLRIPTAPPFAPEFHFHRPDMRDLVGNATLTMNLLGSADVVGASWSLPIEVEMYLVLPLLFTYVRAFSSLWPLLVLDGFAMFYARQTLPSFTSALPMCIPYFLPGIMAYVLFQRTKLRRLPSWLFPVFLFLLIGINHSFGSFRSSWFLCLALGLGLPLFHQIQWPLIRRVSALVARYSYGVYLTHIWAICVAVHTLRAFSMPMRVTAFLAALTALPMLFYHGVERPCIRLGSRLAARIERGPEPRVNETMMRMEPAP